MNPEQMRIKIAEACGWTVINDTLCRPRPQVVRGEQTGDIDLNPVAPLPDYLNDLNAMREAEKILTVESGQVGRYLYNLEVSCHVSGSEARNKAQTFTYITATAAQRAEAFLKTVGKWESDK